MDDPNGRFGTMVLTANPMGTAATAWAEPPRAESAEECFNQGLNALGRGELARASWFLERASVLRPDLPEIWAELAVASFRLGRPAAARDQARTAIRLGLDDARLRGILGLALRALDRPEESLEELRRSVELGPEHPESHVNLGDAHARLGRPAEAQAAYVEAIRRAPRMGIAFARLGASYAQEEKLLEAIKSFIKATEAEPSNSEFWRGLGELYSSVEEYGAAIPCWEKAIALFPRPRAEATSALGWALQEEGRMAEAELKFREAVAIAPNAPEFRVSLGFFLMEKGDLEGAEASYRDALRLHPRHPLATARLASMLRRKLPDDDLARATELLGDPAIEPRQRCSLSFALGQVHDARGDYPRAARHLDEANALQLSFARPHKRFSIEEHQRLHNDLARYFDQSFFDRIAGAGLETRAPVFVIGLPRSGTSLVEQVLASHPEVHGAGELTLGRRMFTYLPIAVGATKLPAECVPDLDGSTVRRLAEAYLERLEAITGTTKARIVDKMPDNAMFIGLLVALFPNATVIHCRRDLRDVALSCWTSDFRSVTWCSDASHIGARFRAYLRLMDHWRATLPTRLIEVDYESVVGDLEGNARRLLDAMGLDWHQNCLSFHETKRPVRTSSTTQVRQPLYSRSVGRWRNYERELAHLFAAIPEGPGRAD